MNIGKFWRCLIGDVQVVPIYGSKPPYVHHPNNDARMESADRAFLETINEMNQANWHHTLSRLERMNGLINSFDSIIRNVDKRMGDAEIALGIKQTALVEKEKLIRKMMRKETNKLNPKKRKKS